MNIKTRVHQAKHEVFDIVRKQWVALTPEEKVRQFMIHKLANFYAIPHHRIVVEKSITVEGTPRRFDLAVFNSKGTLQLIVECKAPEITLTEQTITQVVHYNSVLRAPYMMVTNGNSEHVFYANFETGKVEKSSFEEALNE